MPSPVPLDDDARTRRLKTVSVVLIGALVLLPALVVLVPLAVVVDLVRLRFRLPLARVLLFGACYLGWEVRAVISAAAMWMATGFGRRLDRTSSILYHRRLQQKWATSLMRAMERLLGLDIVASGLEEALPPGGVLISRHASLVDTLLPLYLIGPEGVVFRYILKTELLLDPAIDIIAHRFPNYFVDRSGADSTGELQRIADLAAGTGEDEMFVIFPEGSRFTPEKRARAMEKLSESSPELASLASGMETTMPPRPGGTLAAINALPGRDVVVLAHTGLEGLAGLKELVASVPFRHPVQIATWRIPAAEVPAERAEQERWLFEAWQRVDDWVVANRA